MFETRTVTETEKNTKSILIYSNNSKISSNIKGILITLRYELKKSRIVHYK